MSFDTKQERAGEENLTSAVSSATSIANDANEPFTTQELSRLNTIYRKLDLRVIPALWTLYFLTSFGSSLYGNTLTMNAEVHHSLAQTLKLSPHHLSVASALYYVGYIIFDVPMNIAMTRLAPQVWLSRIVITVGVVYTCYTTLSSPGGLIAIRLISGIVGAGTWPGMSYYISLFYPPHRMTKRIGYYFTAAQLSAASAGLIAAGFMKMDMTRGREGWRWYYLVYGVVTVFVGLILPVWLPDNNANRAPSRFTVINWIRSFNKYPLSGEDKELHERDLQLHRKPQLHWTFKDIYRVLFDVRIWPLVIMYFGVVGTGFGLAVFGTTLIRAVLKVSSINVSLLYAPIWLFDLSAILLITPFSDKFKKFRPLIFSLATMIIITGLLITTFAKPKWSRYGGLLIAGFGLGPTVPTVMSLTAEIFNSRHGDIGIAVSSALVSGLGNLGSVVCTYALYGGWPADKAREFRDSNLVMIGICGMSIIGSFVSWVATTYLGNQPYTSSSKKN